MSASAPSQTVFSIGYDFHVGNGTSGADSGNVWGITNYKDNTRNQSFTYVLAEPAYLGPERRDKLRRAGAALIALILAIVSLSSCAGCAPRSASSSASTASATSSPTRAELDQAPSRRCATTSRRSRTRLDGRLAGAEERLDGAIAYRALVRYDAYNELSGHQSMSIALLDARARASCSRGSTTATRRGCTPSRCATGEAELELSPEEAEAVAAGARPASAP